nr:hypothetical protein [Tanacetum cinerariifolium]
MEFIHLPHPYHRRQKRDENVKGGGRVLKGLVVADVVSMFGKDGRVLITFKEMEEEGCRPTRITTKIMIYVCVMKDGWISRAVVVEQSSDGGGAIEQLWCRRNMKIKMMRVIDLEKTKTTQSNKIASLKMRVKKLEKKNKSRTHKLKRLYKVGLTARVESLDEESLGEDASKQGRIEAIDQDEDITLVNVQDDAEIFDADDLSALEALKTLKPKVKGIVIQEQEVPGKSTTTSTIYKQQSQDTGKAIIIKELVKLKKKDQIRLDEEAAKRLQGEFDEEERLAREKERAQKEQEANIALIET